MAESASTCRQADRINLDDLRAALDRPLKRLTCPHLLLFPLLACCWLFSTNGFVDIFTMQPVNLDDCYCDSHALPLASDLCQACTAPCVALRPMGRGQLPLVRGACTVPTTGSAACPPKRRRWASPSANSSSGLSPIASAVAGRSSASPLSQPSRTPPRRPPRTSLCTRWPRPCSARRRRRRPSPASPSRPSSLAPRCAHS